MTNERIQFCLSEMQRIPAIADEKERADAVIEFIDRVARESSRPETAGELATQDLEYLENCVEDAEISLSELKADPRLGLAGLADAGWPKLITGESASPEVNVIRSLVKNLGAHWEAEALQPDFQERKRQLREKALKIADQLDCAHLYYCIYELGEKEIKSVKGVDKHFEQIMSLCRRLPEGHERQGAIDLRIARALENCAWWRARQRLGKAEEREQEGKNQGAAKLRAEATQMLAEDWEKYFPGEKPPPIS